MALADIPGIGSLFGGKTSGQAAADKVRAQQLAALGYGPGNMPYVAPPPTPEQMQYQASAAEAMPATPVSTMDNVLQPNATDQISAQQYPSDLRVGMQQAPSDLRVGMQQAPSVAAGAQSDPAAVWAQHAALAEMARTYGMGGLNEIDRARMAQDRAEQAQQAKAQELAIMQNAQEQGRGGGNAQLMAQLNAQQGAANRMNMADLQTQALGLQRRDSLLNSAGNLGGQIEGQTFGENFQRGGAQDVVNQYNTQGQRNYGLSQNDINKYNVQGQRDYGASQNDINRYNTAGVRDWGAAQNAVNQFNTLGARQSNQFNAAAGNTASLNYAQQEAARRAAYAGAQNQASAHNAGAPQTYYGDVTGQNTNVANVLGGNAGTIEQRDIAKKAAQQQLISQGIGAAAAFL